MTYRASRGRKLSDQVRKMRRIQQVYFYRNATVTIDGVDIADGEDVMAKWMLDMARVGETRLELVFDGGVA